MGVLARWIPAVAAAVVLGIGVASCGEDSDSDSPADTVTRAQQPAEAPSSDSSDRPSQPSPEAEEEPSKDSSQAAAPPVEHDDSGGGTEQFRSASADNSVQEFGSEATGSDFEEAAAALHGFLDARAVGDWAASCEYISTEIVESLQQLASRSPKLKEKDCGELMAALSGAVPESVRKEAAIADVGALRVEGDQGFLLYEGARNTNYAISMANEDGEWKVASLAGYPLS